ncbi:MAG TPA: cytochrome c oxidase assembly protein [Acidimicrobiales bacterium]|nr:cytochrome c oxidase assembly protein [Acidimicrobiales bacterium]
MGRFPLLLGEELPALRGHQFLTTSLAVVPVLMVLGALVLYLWGARRIDRLQPRHPWPRVKTLAFVGGVVSTSLAVFSFIGAYDRVLFWDHMVQHLLLVMVAAPLFALASPIDLAWRATTGATHRRVGSVLRSGPAKFFGQPAVAFALYAVVIPLTHLTSWYNYTLVHESVHDGEHLVFLVVGYLFWRQIFGSDPNRYRLHPALQFAYLFLAIPIDTFTGLSLDGATHELFPAYLASPRTWGPSLITDLHVGGVIMWVGGDTLMLWPMIPVALRWMHIEERRAARVDRRLDAMYASEVPSPLGDGTGGA